jgi:hypothetical protein
MEAILLKSCESIQFDPMTKGTYTKRGRLGDVLALIQVLAFDPDTHRSESGIVEKELGPPVSSTGGWVALAKEHPEIFRVSDEARNPLSLVARHVQPSDPTKKRPPLSAEFTQTLIKTAIELHDRQMDAAARWKHFVPLWTALITGLLVIASSLLTLKFAHPTQPGRFVRAGDPFPDAILLDTVTGRYCYGDMAGQKNPSNVPSCKDLR